MITAEEVSKQRNIKVRAVQKKAKEVGIEKRNGRYIFTDDDLERMYGYISLGRKHFAKGKLTHNKALSTQQNATITHSNYENDSISDQVDKYDKTIGRCRSKIFEVNNLLMEHKFQDENLEKSRQSILGLMMKSIEFLKEIKNTEPTNDSFEYEQINADDLVVE